MDGKTRQDKDAEKAIIKRFGQAEGKRILRGMDTTINRPKDEECFTCDKMDIVKPFQLECCSKCVRRYAEKKGKVRVFEKKARRGFVTRHKFVESNGVLIPLKPKFVPDVLAVCPVCDSGGNVHYAISADLCFKCINKFGKKDNEYGRDIKPGIAKKAAKYLESKAG